VSETSRSGLTRRRFLASTAVAGAGAVMGTLGAGVLGGVAALAAPASPAPSSAPPVSGISLAPVIIPFEGIHQAGIDRPRIAQPNAILAAFDVVAADRAGLAALLAELTQRIRDLTAGTPPPPIDDSFPAPESGVLGPSIGPSSLTVTVAVGASLFDDRFGLGDRTPTELTAMPRFAGDVIDPARTHGDLLLQICAVDEMACVHALRYLMGGTRSWMALRWMEDGFHRPDAIAAEGKTTTRNLLGFKDGTANPSVAGDDFASLVWVTPDDAEPTWASNGSYMAVRLIRMFVERWDRAPLAEQQTIIGRSKRTGAPLDGQREEDIPDYATDPAGATVALDAHIRLANPRTAATERNRIFRRGYSFSRGFDAAGLLDQGLAFVCFQRSLEDGFTTIQRRLDNEPLAEYIQPQGGGFFFALPGVVHPAANLGDSLLA
jgi:deferrochelatase/peroxidase EfeB